MKLAKLFAAALGGALVLSSLTLVSADTTDPVVTYDFESDQGIEMYGDVAIVENPDDSSDHVLLIDESEGGMNGNYGLLPEGTLSGNDFSAGITVSVDVRPTVNSGSYNYIFCVGASGTSSATSSGYAYVDGAIGLVARYGDTYEALIPYGHFVDGNNMGDDDQFFLTEGCEDRWYNLTFTYARDSICIYVDGVQAVEYTPSNQSDLNTILGALADDAAIVFGAGASRGDLENFGGYIDDLRIFEGALTADEVATVVDASAYEMPEIVSEETEESEDTQESGDSEEESQADVDAQTTEDAAADETADAQTQETTAAEESTGGVNTVAIVIFVILVVVIVVLLVLFALKKLPVSKNVMMAIIVILAVVAIVVLVVGIATGGGSGGGSDVVDTTEAETEIAEEGAPVYEPSTTLIETYDVERSQTDRSGVEDGEVALSISTYTNPLVGYSDDDDYTYGGDPFVLVDGDTVYLYTGHDVATGSAYNIPEYICWSTTDLVNWTYEGVVMSADKDSVSWANTNTDGWAAQVAKHYDTEAGKYMYYMYYCTWDRTSDGKQSIGVAVSDSATGPFVDIGEPLVSGNVTADDETSTWNDIDPTVWIEYDDEGVEHRYLAWGNGQYYICELNEDMVSVTDRNGDGKITCGSSADDNDIISGLNSGLSNYTEGPWLYRRTDEYGNVTGDYYLFYASGWREAMSYATTSDLLNEKWTTGGTIMTATATSNTIHPAVFDFKGHTYMIWHNGSLPGGDGYRRSACMVELIFNDDGSISRFDESAAGVGGTISQIALADGRAIGHYYFTNSGSDNSYPYTTIATGYYEDPDPTWDDDFSEKDLQWVICAGKADTDNAAYVSIQSENKPGLYLTANEDMSVTLAQEASISDDIEAQMTFHTVVGLNDEDGVSFESVAYPGNYLTMVDNVLMLTDGSDAENATFYVSVVE